jgi:N-acetylglucosamine-6-phosphate deacetylase
MTILLNAQLPRKPGRYCLEVQHGLVLSIMPMAKVLGNAVQAIDLKGDWISLGGVDLQINGALGLAFPDLQDQHLPTLGKIATFLWGQGIDGFLPTLVTTPADNIQRSLAVIRTFQKLSAPGPQAQILGVHLEGPFLNPAKRGAHPEEFLQPLTLERVQNLVGDFLDVVKVITLAPELDPTGTVIDWLRSHHITVSLGHSLATAAQAQAAFDQGATMVTHAFNAMPGLHHRQPGLLGAALQHPQVACGFIADGQHIGSTMLDLFLRICRGRVGNREGQCEGLFLVSDALAPLGLPDGVYPWDSREIAVQQGTARLPEGTLVGTTLPLLEGVKNLVEWGLCEVGDAIALATEAPRQSMGLPGLTAGKPAHLLRWHWDGQTLSWERLLV